MKYFILAAAIMAASTPSLAQSLETLTSRSEHSTFRGGAGIAYYGTDSSESNEHHAGGYFDAEYANQKTGLGYQFGLQGLKYDDQNVVLSDIGVLYSIPLPTQRLAVMPEVGVSHGHMKGSSEISHYLGLNLQSYIVPESLSATLSAKRYDLSDEQWESYMYGLKLSYKIDKETFIDPIIEDAGLLSRVGVGFGFYF